MDDQALTNAALDEGSSVHDRVMDKPWDEFKAEFTHVLSANADDKDEATSADPDAGRLEPDQSVEAGQQHLTRRRERD